jgi:low affinity Fe/Cu permease
LQGARPLSGRASKEAKMDRLFTAFATRVAWMVGQPAVFILACVVVVGWALAGPVFGFSDTWQLVINTSTTIVTFLMVFLIQNSQNRDGAATQAKLDELLRAVGNARAAFIGIEHMTDAELELIREAIEREAGEPGENGKGLTARETVDRLLRRF